MPRFNPQLKRLFLPAPLEARGEVAVSAEQAHYLRHVLRMREGAEILVFNGADGEFHARVVIAGKRDVRLRIGELRRPQPAPGQIAYAFAPLKHARLDYLVQKAVEMGACRMTPVRTQHSQTTRFNAERARANIIEAAEQCGILAVPRLDSEISLSQFLANLAPDHLLVFCDEEAPQGSALEHLVNRGRRAVTVLVGPEGGFSETERAAILRHSPVIRFSLGPRILRADTAAVAALALVQATIGDWQSSPA